MKYLTLIKFAFRLIVDEARNDHGYFQLSSRVQPWETVFFGNLISVKPTMWWEDVGWNYQIQGGDLSCKNKGDVHLI